MKPKQSTDLYKRLKLEKPISEKKMPPAVKGGNSKFQFVWDKAMKLKDGDVLPVVCRDAEDARRFAALASHASYAQFRTFTRDKTVYIRLRNEADDKQRRHIQTLREKAKQKRDAAKGQEPPVK